MSTFIYRDGKLTADRRKLCNIDGLNAMVSMNESKVRDFGWCLFAMSGNEPSEKNITNTLQSITIMECLHHLRSIVLEFAKYSNKIKDPQAHAIAAKGNKYITVIHKLIHACMSLLGQDSTADSVVDGLLMTNQVVWRINQYPRRFIIGEVALHGAGSGLADILLTAGISTKEIYQHLSDCGVPTGPDFDTYEQKNILQLAPPVFDIIWIAALVASLDGVYNASNNATYLPGGSGRVAEEELCEFLCAVAQFTADNDEAMETRLSFNLPQMRMVFLGEEQELPYSDSIRKLIGEYVSSIYKTEKEEG